MTKFWVIYDKSEQVNRQYRKTTKEIVSFLDMEKAKAFIDGCEESWDSYKLIEGREIESRESE